MRLVMEHRDGYRCEWEAIPSVALTMGCTVEPLRAWIRQTERDTGQRVGLTTEERPAIHALARKVYALRQASAIVAPAELDHRDKR